MVESRPGRGSSRRALPRLTVVLLVFGLWASMAGADTCCICPTTADQLTAEDAQITLKLIMSDPDWLGNPPENAYWQEDGKAVFFEQKRRGEEHRGLYRIELATSEITQVADEERGMIDIPEGRLSQDLKLKVYSRHGDIYLQDLIRGEITQLTRTSELEIDPFFMAATSEGTSPRVAFTRAGQIFVRDLESGLESQGADLRLTQDPADPKDEDGSAFLRAQQLRLFDHLRREERQNERTRELAELEQSTDPSRPPLPFYLGDQLEIRQSAFSPAGDAMLLVVIDKKRDDGRKDQMPAWITASGYVDSQEVRPKVGTDDGRGERLLYLDLKNHQQHEIDLSTLPGIADDPLADLKQQALAAKADAESKAEASDEDSAPADRQSPGSASNESEDATAETDQAESREDAPRAVRFEEALAWSPDGRSLAVQAHSYDNKDRWLALVDFEEHRLQRVHHLKDAAWINWSYNEFGWLADSRRLYFLSEASGSSQLYLYSLDDGATRRLTDGRGVVSDVRLDRQEQYFYYTANPDHPGTYETFRVAIEGGQIEQLTRLGGQSSSLLSPDGKNLLITHSTTTRPPELYLQPARPGAEARRITHTVSERFTSLPWVEPAIVGVPSSHHSRPIYSRFYPSQCDREGATAASRPAVVFVHGAGYLQNAHRGWSGYFREFMFHTLLTRHGYAVLDMDYRASAGYGVEWRTAIYRQMGTPELEDLTDGVAWLVAEHGVDPDRVGVYGGSYGGFLTLMALFQQPDLFACGAALRPVTDWSQYNHPYTSNILNTPDVDPEAYRRSSPIEHAAGLAAPLLLCAPMQDDNVFFSDTVRLVQRLIELEKEDWEVAIYPVEPHSFRRPSSWLDEYRRIFKLFETHLGR